VTDGQTDRGSDYNAGIASGDKKQKRQQKTGKSATPYFITLVLSLHSPGGGIPLALLRCRSSVRVTSKKGSPYSITDRRVPELIPVLGSQPAADVSRIPVGRLPLLSARPAVTPATLKRAATNFAAW